MYKLSAGNVRMVGCKFVNNRNPCLIYLKNTNLSIQAMVEGDILLQKLFPGVF